MKLIKLLRFCAYLVCFATIAAPATVDSTKALEGFDASVIRAMRDLQAPGVAVGAIVDGRVILAKGYGVRELGQSATVTPDTIFAVGSMTKSFTAVTVAAMVDEGKLNWDRPVREYLPWFRMYDPVATELITPRDLLTHRSGMPGHNFIRFSTPLDRAELVRRIRYLEPSHTFREVYQYNNLMYVTAGFLAGEVAGKSWEDLVEQRIFTPLGMTSSTVRVADTQKRKDFAKPHLSRNGAVTSTEFYDYQKFGVGPNGAVNSTVNDLLKYLQFHLDNGKANGRQLISATQMQQLHRPVTVTASGDGAYALGWTAQHHRGHAVLQHGGAITGFTSMMVLIPETKTGVIVLNNLGTSLPTVVAWDLADRLLGLEPEDYLAETKQRLGRSRATAEEKRKQTQALRVPGAKPSLRLAAYAGEYSHPAYGTIRVDQNETGLVVRFAALNIPLTHYNYDTFECESEYMEGMAQFHLNPQGGVSEMLLPLEAAVKPLVFLKLKR
jgi:CubicO group peptidase (beta-lactamase class C family)